MGRWMGRRGVVVACAVVAGIVMLPGPALAWQAFVKITTSTGVIAGDVTVKGFEKQINVLGVGNQLNVARDAASGTATKFSTGEFQIAKTFDIATPKLITAMGAFTNLPKVEITLFKQTPTGSAPGFRITLTNAMITSLDTTYNPGTEPSAVERVEMVYQKLTWQDLVTGATGSTP